MQPSAGPVGGRDPSSRPSWLLAVAVTVLLALAAIGLAWTSRVEFATPDRRDPSEPLADEPAPPSAPPASEPNCGADACGVPLGPVVSVAVFALVVFAVALVVYGLWRFRWRRIGGLRREERLDLVGLRQMLAAGRQALLRRSDDAGSSAGSAADAEAREAVIACYRAMENALERAGVDRGVSGTPTGLLQDAVERGLFAESAAAYAGELTELFERARFTGRAIEPGDRDRARRLLSALEASIGQDAEPGVGEGAGSAAR